MTLGAKQYGTLSGQGAADAFLHICRRALIAVVPGYINRFAGGVFGAGIDVMDLGVDVPAVRALHRCGAFAADAERRGEADGTVHGIINMAAHIAKRAGAVVEAFAPVAGVVIAADVIVFRRHTAPGIPVEPGGHLVFAVGTLSGVAPFLAAPGMHLGYFTNRTLMHKRYGFPIDLAGMHLDTHLGGEFVSDGKFSEFAAFEHVVSKRFLYINVFTELHGGHGDRRVHVIGCGHIGGVEILGLLVEELTPVGVAFALGEFTGKAILTCWIDLGTGHHLNVFHTGNGVYIGKGHAVGTKGYVANGGVRRERPGARRHIRKGEGRGGQKIASGQRIGFHVAIVAGWPAFAIPFG